MFIVYFTVYNCVQYNIVYKTVFSLVQCNVPEKVDDWHLLYTVQVLCTQTFSLQYSMVCGTQCRVHQIRVVFHSVEYSKLYSTIHCIPPEKGTDCHIAHTVISY